MSDPAGPRASLLGLDPATYVPHVVHGPGRGYPETNCYTDILVELLHARGDEPLAVLGTTLRTDFEGDQFSFFKPHPADLEDLLGVDVHEMQPHRELPLQALEQLRAGRTVTVELDAFHLPDTAATDYGRNHVKTSVVVEAIDTDAKELRYFHNGGLHVLSGADYDGVFAHAANSEELPPYVELVRFDAGPRLTGEALRSAARERSRRHLARRPDTNPFARFGAQLEEDLPALLAGGPEGFHSYAFATVRMAGAAFELAASHADWVAGEAAAPASTAFGQIAEGCKVLSFRLARRRAFDPAERIAALAAAWAEGMDALERALG